MPITPSLITQQHPVTLEAGPAVVSKATLTPDGEALARLVATSIQQRRGIIQTLRQTTPREKVCADSPDATNAETAQVRRGMIDDLLEQVSRPESNYYGLGLCSMALVNHSDRLRTLILKFRLEDGDCVEIPISEMKTDGDSAGCVSNELQNLHCALKKHRAYENRPDTEPLILEFGSTKRSEAHSSALRIYEQIIDHIQQIPAPTQSDLDEALNHLVTPAIHYTLGPRLYQMLRIAALEYALWFNTTQGKSAEHGRPANQTINLNKQALGRVKWGIQKKRIDTALTSHTSTIHAKSRMMGLKKPPAQTASNQHLTGPLQQEWDERKELAHITQWGGALLSAESNLTAVGNNAQDSELHQLTIQFALKWASEKTGISVQSIHHSLANWDCVEWIKNQRARAGNDSPMEKALWLAVTQLASTPTGLDACKNQFGPCWKFTPREQELLLVLSKGYNLLNKTQKDLPNGLPNLGALLNHCRDEDKIVARAFVSSAAELCGETDSNEALENAWAVNAIRNGLYSTSAESDFGFIAKRLNKCTEWVDRATRKPGFKDGLLPFKRKTPFAAMRFGKMGIDQVEPCRNKEGILNNLQSAVNAIQGASRLKLTGGGLAGVGTKGASGTLSQLLSGFMLRVRGDIRLAKQRTAHLELAMPAYDLELMLYTQAAGVGQIGGGVAAGPILGPVQLSLGVDAVGYSHERTQAEGIVLRMPRVRGQEAQMKKSFNNMLEDLLTSPKDKPAQQLLQELLGKYPHLTIAKIGHHAEEKTKHELSAEAGAAVDTGLLKVSHFGGIGLEYQSAYKKQSGDGTGALRVQRTFGGASLRANVGTKLNLGYGAWSGAFKLNAITLESLALSVDFLTAGRRIRIEIVRNNNQLSPSSFYEIEHASLEDFTQFILENLESWITARSTSSGKTAQEARTDIEKFLDSLSENYATNLTYAQRFELKPSCARRLDQYETLISLSKAMKSRRFDNYSYALHQKIQNTLMNPNSYTPSSFRVFDRDEKLALTGLQFSFRLQKIQQAEGVYVHSRMM